jgi:hypothetical protein
MAQLVQHCVLTRNFACSIPDGFIGHNPSSRTIALASTQTLTEISSRNIS